MKSVVVAALVPWIAACGFDGAPATVTPGTDATADGVLGDGTIDAAIDARMIDAAACPDAPSGCMAFSCATTSCYYLCTTKLSFDAAKMRCQNENVGCLARIDDLAEDMCLYNFAMPDFNAGTIAYFGFSQARDQNATDAGWSWTCGDTDYLAANWGLFEPNDNDSNAPFMEMNRENCAALTGNNAWLDVGCTETRRYICELER